MEDAKMLLLFLCPARVIACNVVDESVLGGDGEVYHVGVGGWRERDVVHWGVLFPVFSNSPSYRRLPALLNAVRLNFYYCIAHKVGDVGPPMQIGSR